MDTISMIMLIKELYIYYIPPSYPRQHAGILLVINKREGNTFLEKKIYIYIYKLHSIENASQG